MFFKKERNKDQIISSALTNVSEQLSLIYIRLGKLESENMTIHDKIDKLEIRTRKDKSQRPQESEESPKKGVFLRPDGTFINT